MPKFNLHSNTRPSMFDYPPEQEVKTEEAPEKVKTAVLSTTAQAKRRKLAKDRLNRRESMDVDVAPPTPKAENASTAAADADKMDEDTEKPDAAAATGAASSTSATTSTKKKLEREKVGFEVENMSRVLPGQIRYMSFPEDGRYQPVKTVSPYPRQTLTCLVHY